MSQEKSDVPAFAVGDKVKLLASNTTGTVVHRKLDDAGEWIYIVDRPQGAGTMRQYFVAGDLA